MIKTVTASLPYPVDRATIHKTIEECKGDIDVAITKLLDIEDGGSVSSAQGSDSVEREVESDDEYNSGPNKKQDRRLSRATRALKDKEDNNHDLTFRPKNHAPVSSTGPSPLRKKPVVRKSSVDGIGESEDETYTPDPKYVDSDSDSDAGSERAAPKKSKGGGVRLRLSQPKPEVEQSPASERPRHNGPTNMNGTGRSGRTQPRATSPKPKRITAREKRDMKKLAQKAQAKARKQGIAGDKIASSKNGSIAAAIKDGKENSPAIDVGIKTLYI